LNGENKVIHAARMRKGFTSNLSEHITNERT